MHNCCNNYTRSQLLRSAAAEAGKGLPAIEPGMPTPAGTGLSRRSFLSWSAGLALSVYGASKIPLAAFEEGIAQAAQGDKILVSVFFDGGIDALSVLAPVGDPRYSQLRPNLALSPEAGTEFTEDTGLRWHPAPKRWRPSTARARSAPSRRSGTNTPTSRTSPRATTTRSASSRSGSAPAGSAATSTWSATDDNPLQGLSMDGRLSPMIATADKPVAAIDSVDGYDLWSAGQRPGLRRDVQELRQVRLAAGRLARPRPGAAGDHPDREAAPGPRRRRRLHQPRDLSRQPTSPTSSPASPPTSALGLPLKVVTISAAGRLRHPRRPGRRPRPQPARNLRRPARLPARPRGARARRPGPGRDVERVRPPARGERLRRDRPRRRRLRVRDRVESEGRNGRRIPRPGDPRRTGQPARRPATSGRCTARCSRNGSATTRPRSSPAPPGSRGRPW